MLPASISLSAIASSPVQPMFRIVENSDGSTSILDRLSGKLLTVIPGKQRVSKDVQNEPSSVLSPIRSNSSNRLPLSPAPATAVRTACSAALSEPVKSSIASNDGCSEPSAPSGAEPVRRLRPRNIQPEYNEDRAFEALIRPGNGVLAMSYAVADGSDGSSQKPDHLVVVYKHSPECQAETPNRMRLLPAVTLNKLQAGLHHPKSKAAEQRNMNSIRFPVEPSEPENDCIDQHTFSQYLNLIPAASLAKKPVSELKQQWPLRQHSRPWPSTRAKNSMSSAATSARPLAGKSLQATGNKSALTELQARTEVEKNMWFSGLKSKEKFVTSQKTPQNVVHLDTNGVLHMIPSSGGENNVFAKQSLMQRKLSCGSSCSSLDVRPVPLHDRDIVSDLPLHAPSETMKGDQRKVMLKRFVKKYMLKPAEYYKPGVEMSSPLGKRLLEAYATIVQLHSVTDILRFVKFYERHCSTSSLTHRQLLQSIKCSFSPKVKIDFSLPSPSKNNLVTTRLLRSQLIISPTSNAWGLKSYHIYAFSKQERLEKSLTQTAGLDWKGRLLALHCDNISVDVNEKTCCDLCQQPLAPDAGHCCPSPGPRPLLPEPSPPDQVQDLVTLDDDCDIVSYSLQDLHQNSMILCDEDDEDMDEDEEVILIGSASPSIRSIAPSGGQESGNYSGNSNGSPVEVLIEF